MARTRKGPHPADLADAKIIARADGFSAVMMLGGGNIVRTEHASAEDALAGAAALTAEWSAQAGTRRAVAYAYLSNTGTCQRLITPALLALARELQAEGKAC